MREVELKDLNVNTEYIIAYKNDKNKWISCVVNIVKEYTVKIIRSKNLILGGYSPLEKNKEYSIKDFYYRYIGNDMFGHKVFALVVFKNSNECINWCKKENEFNEYLKSLEEDE